MPLWAQLIIDALFIFGWPFVGGYVLDLVRLRAQRLPDHRIEAVERLANQATKSMAPLVSLDARKAAADVALLELCKEYGVAIPDKKAREYAISAALFDIGG